MTDVLISFYENISSVILRIDVLEREWLIKFYNELAALLNNNIRCIDVLNFNNAEAKNVNKLQILKVNKPFYPNITWDVGNIEIEWHLTSDELYNIQGLIEGLINCGGGHQYLSNDHDGMIVLLAYNELP